MTTRTPRDRSKVRATVRLPRALYNEAQRLLNRGASSAQTMNELFVDALSAWLRMYKRRQIDAAFAGMAQDSDYQRESSTLAESFSQSDWEALRSAEEELAGRR